MRTKKYFLLQEVGSVNPIMGCVSAYTNDELNENIRLCVKDYFHATDVEIPLLSLNEVSYSPDDLTVEVYENTYQISIQQISLY